MTISTVLDQAFLSFVPKIRSFFDEDSNTFSYVVQDPNSTSCAIIDSVLDFDYASGAITYAIADDMIGFIETQGLVLEWIIETHVHADHLTAAPYIQAKLGGKIAISQHISAVQDTFADIYNEGKSFCRNGSQFDYLFNDNESYFIGTMKAFAIHTPGHTPACMTHVIGDAAFVGDTLFMPDGGTARADFPGGNASVLYQSIQKILSLPENTRLFMCHDYCPNGRDIEYQTTVKQQREHNIHVKEGISENSFVAMREQRDATLSMPRLIFPSLQVNMAAGNFPEPEENNRRYLKVPVNAFS